MLVRPRRDTTRELILVLVYHRGPYKHPLREAPETVAHYLFACPTYALHRAVHFRPLGHSGRTLATVLNKHDALTPLFNYINATGRFRSIYGSLDNALPDGSDAT